ncbi:hypothetical protein KIL84_004729 [Mauremys mutica]|uniref:Uncharacterized protein n=1 Tax=Mauremys mutica TaxID=74926 RepID=A0A9D4B0A2_9SAUR|nr:hypothetical protein KIL84_004729 [Mauremys mutica]
MFSKVVWYPLTSYRSTMVLHLSLTCSFTSCQYQGELHGLSRKPDPLKWVYTQSTNVSLCKRGRKNIILCSNESGAVALRISLYSSCVKSLQKDFNTLLKQKTHSVNLKSFVSSTSFSS